MHDDELTVTEAQVRALLADQHPQWADLPVRALPHRGTDHAMFRLGEDHAVRLPRIEWARGCVDREWEWQRRIAPMLGWESPLPLAQGEPGHGYPWRWSVVRWVHGEPPAAPDVALAADVARLLQDFRALHVPGGRPARRSHPLIWRVALSRGRVKRRPRPSPWAPLRLPDGGARGGERVGVDASSV